MDHGNENLIYTAPNPGAFCRPLWVSIGNGTPRRLTDLQEKLYAAQVLIHHYINKIPVALKATDMNHVALRAIDVTYITAGIHHPKTEWSTALGMPVEKRHGKHHQDGKVVFDDTDYQSTNDHKADASTGPSQTNEEK